MTRAIRAARERQEQWHRDRIAFLSKLLEEAEAKRDRDNERYERLSALLVELSNYTAAEVRTVRQLRGYFPKGQYHAPYHATSLGMCIPKDARTVARTMLDESGTRIVALRAGGARLLDLLEEILELTPRNYPPADKFCNQTCPPPYQCDSGDWNFAGGRDRDKPTKNAPRGSAPLGQEEMMGLVENVGEYPLVALGWPLYFVSQALRVDFKDPYPRQLEDVWLGGSVGWEGKSPKDLSEEELRELFDDRLLAMNWLGSDWVSQNGTDEVLEYVNERLEWYGDLLRLPRSMESIIAGIPEEEAPTTVLAIYLILHHDYALVSGVSGGPRGLWGGRALRAGLRARRWVTAAAWVLWLLLLASLTLGVWGLGALKIFELWLAAA